MSVPIGYKMSPEAIAKARASYAKTVTPEYLEKRRRERFYKRLIKSEDVNGCWIWSGALDKDGYGQTRVLYEHVKAHRYAFELANGPIYGGLMVCHSCDNPPCCNPAHLFLGTALDNNKDMMSKERHRAARGEDAGQAKLTENEVREIRRLHATGEFYHWQLGEKFNVSQGAIAYIVTRKRWAHIL